MQDWATQACPVKGDKVARATAVQAVFANLGVYCPTRDWADMVMQEMAVFPNGKYDDLTDSATQAIKWLRDNGFAPTDEEVLYAEEDRIKLKPKEKSLYPI
jgi:phage terminase large subunit-like protein